MNVSVKDMVGKHGKEFLNNIFGWLANHISVSKYPK